MSNPSKIGGTELQFKLIASTLFAKGLLKIGMTTGKNRTISELKNSGVYHLPAGFITRIKHHKCLSLILKRFKTPILHIFKPSSASMIRAAKLAGMRVVYTETGLPENNAAWAPLAPHINEVDYVISVSEAGLTQLREKLGYQGPGSIISSMIETPPEGLRARMPKAETFNLIYFGRMAVGKGIDHLLHAFALVIPSHPYAMLTLIGEGRELRRLKRLVSELKLENHVRFFNFLSRDLLFEQIADSDLFCLPSLSEGCPCSIIEAMAVGLPVVATRVGGIPELVVHEETGLLVPCQDVSAFSNALLRLAADPDLRVKMGRAGLKRYQERLSQNVAIEKLITVYQTILK